MFSLTEKQSFWINLILGSVFSFLFIGAVFHLNIIGILLYGVFSYLSLNTLRRHWQTLAYPFNSTFWMKVRRKINKAPQNNAKRW